MDTAIQVVQPQKGRQGDRQEGMHQVSWAVSVVSQAVSQASGCEGIQVGNEQPAYKFWEEGGAGQREAVSAPCRSLRASLTLSSSTELRALPARTWWRTRKVPEGEAVESDFRKSGGLCPQLLSTFPAPHPHPQTKHLPICNK